MPSRPRPHAGLRQGSSSPRSTPAQRPPLRAPGSLSPVPPTNAPLALGRPCKTHLPLHLHPKSPPINNIQVLPSPLCEIAALIPEDIKATKALSSEGIRVNVTLCFTAAQALLAAKAGAYIIRPFIGRLDDISHEGMDLIREIVAIYENYGFRTQVLAASIRGPLHVKEAALAGAHIAILPAKVLDQLFHHPLTDSGLEKFLADYRRTLEEVCVG